MAGNLNSDGAAKMNNAKAFNDLGEISPLAATCGTGQSTSTHGAFFSGARAMTVLIPGVVPFGIILGVTSIEFGLSFWQAQGMNFMVLGGASQLAVMRLMAGDAPLWVAVLTGCIINLRMVMYSAALAPVFRSSGFSTKAAAAFMLTDQAFAMTISRFTGVPELSAKEKVLYYLGTGISFMTIWHSSVIVGLIFGNIVPAGFSLDFAVPLCFASLVLPLIRSRPHLIAAIAAALLSIQFSDLPYNLGLIVSTILAIAVGYFMSSDDKPVDNSGWAFAKTLPRDPGVGPFTPAALEKMR